MGSEMCIRDRQKYSAFDRELLALYLAVKHFRGSLEGRRFVIYTNHKPLCGAITSAVEKSPRQTRHLSFVAEYSTDIRHVSGASNVVADALSRPAVPQDLADGEAPSSFVHDTLVGSVALCPGLDLAGLSLAQRSSAAVQAFALLRRNSSLDLRDLPLPGSEDTTILCDVSQVCLLYTSDAADE